MIDKELHNKLILATDVLADCSRELWHSGHDTYARQVRTALTVVMQVRDGVEKVLADDNKET